MRPELISVSDTVTQAGFDSGDTFALVQSLDDANSGKLVEMTWDVQLTGLDPEQGLVLNIDRGGLGWTKVTIFNYMADSPVEVKTFRWGGTTNDRNSFTGEIPSEALMNP